MRYVDAGYIVAIGGSFLYGLSLYVRRQRWERALPNKEPVPDERPAAAEHP